jgi:hypothetical protein
MNLSPDRLLFNIQAQYLIDQLDGDAEKDPTLPDSCVLLTQTYEFYQEGLVALEPFGLFPSAKFRPLVSYQYFTDTGPTLQSLTTAQRLFFDANSTLKDGSQLKSPVNDTLLACDPDPSNLTATVCLPLGLGFQSVLGVYNGNNPALQESYLRIIQGGNSKISEDPTRLGGLLPTVVDNVHFNATPTNSPNAPIDEPGLTAFGCPVCVHVHWRWSGVINTFPVNTLIQFDPTFDQNKGKPKVPVGSNQDVDIAVLRSGDKTEEHPISVKGLFQQGTSLLPTDLMSAPSPSKPVFWYMGTGHQVADQFFIHGGGFGTFYVNKIAVLDSTTLSLNLEHTRDIDYNIQVVRNDVVVLGTHGPARSMPVVLTATPSSTGTLPAGTDDLLFTYNDVFFGSDNVVGGLDVTVTLTDQKLASIGAPKNIWKRTFHFDSAPTTLEP